MRLDSFGLDLLDKSGSSGDASLALDADLPLLGEALRAETIWGKLRNAPGFRADLDEITSAALIDFKPGLRALIAYEARASEGRPVIVFGKHFADRVQAKRVYETLVAVHSATRNRGSRWDVPSPLGWLPEHTLVLYAPVEGRFLDEVADGADRGRHLRLAGECLAELHMTGLSFDRRLDLKKEAASVRTWAEAVAAADPPSAPRVLGLAKGLAGLEPSLRLDGDFAIHKDFHYKHVVVGPKLTMLDVDEMRLGDPAFDVAHFCAHLYLLGLRIGTSPAALQQSFLEGYASATTWAPDERFDYFFAYTCVKMAWLLCLGLGVRPRPVGVERQRQVEAVLAFGESRLSSL